MFHCSKLRNSRINAKYSLFPTMKTRISVAKPHVGHDKFFEGKSKSNDHDPFKKLTTPHLSDYQIVLGHLRCPEFHLLWFT